MEKDKRVVSQETIDRLRKKDGTCMLALFYDYGQCTRELHQHHVEHKGAGGDDTPDNLITLCSRHHNMAHTGEIPRSVLEDVAQKTNQRRGLLDPSPQEQARNDVRKRMGEVHRSDLSELRERLGSLGNNRSTVQFRMSRMQREFQMAMDRAYPMRRRLAGTGSDQSDHKEPKKLVSDV